ncbi:DegT/DnrJ/EryC1/StrS family aminotransferase [Paenibacillus koleovorans]|uniref:DegT/DnrJ/EryC1/StrS family aminotransferase n=1 Tax=Paenibacillus koleovorans TaxID=121608 RepID=UPI000FDBB850|nr:DegT/DnrJ/EryC1/StrS family aminotransferase [Paenibacillus koleovorans]
MSILAIHGGTPARKQPLPPNYPGAMLFGEEERAASERIIQAQSPFRYYGANPQHTVLQLENAMRDKLGVPYALGVTSGTAALIVALRAVGVGAGDKVIVPANTFLATATAVICCNAVPVFADIDRSLNIDPLALEAAMDEEVKAIIAVPILGTPCDMDPIMAFGRKHGIAVIEDVAQSCGVVYRGRYQGTIGDAGAFSFQMNKVITAGEGGAVVMKRADYFERAVRYHDQGSLRERTRYGFDSPDELGAFAGQNYRMSELTGSVMLEQWSKLDTITQSMRKHHKQIRAALSSRHEGLEFRYSPDESGDLGSNLGLILPDAAEAERFSYALQAENINSFVLYGGQPVYKQPQIWHQRTIERDNFPFSYPFKKPVVYRDGLCPTAENLIPRTVFVPISPLLTDEDADEIAAGIGKVAEWLSVRSG